MSEPRNDPQDRNSALLNVNRTDRIQHDSSVVTYTKRSKVAKQVREAEGQNSDFGDEAAFSLVMHSGA